MCEVRIRLWIWTERISHAEALISMSEAVVNSSPLLVRCVFVSDSSIFVTNIFSLILGISVAVLAFPDGENVRSKHASDLRFSALVEALLCMRAQQQCVPQSALPGPCVHARPVSCKAQPLTGFVLVFPRGNADFAGSRLRIKEIGSQASASETEAGEGLNVRLIALQLFHVIFFIPIQALNREGLTRERGHKLAHAN